MRSSLRFFSLALAFHHFPVGQRLFENGRNFPPFAGFDVRMIFRFGLGFQNGAEANHHGGFYPEGQ